MGHPCISVRSAAGLRGEARGIPHLAKNERDAPNFLHAALDRTACAALIKESRMKFREPTKLHRKSGMRGTRRIGAGIEPKNLLSASRWSGMIPSEAELSGGTGG
jgi:hypothetical protein